MQISDQQVATKSLCPETLTQSKTPLEMPPMVELSSPATGQCSAPEVCISTPPRIKRLLARLSHSLEMASMLVQSRKEYLSEFVQFDFRYGLVITKRHSYDGREEYKTEGLALSITIKGMKHITRRLTLSLSILYGTAYAPGLSIRSNLYFAPVLPLDNPAFVAVQLGDINHLSRILSTNTLAVTAATDGGYTLLHVRTRIGIIN